MEDFASVFKFISNFNKSKKWCHWGISAIANYFSPLSSVFIEWANIKPFRMALRIRQLMGLCQRPFYSALVIVIVSGDISCKNVIRKSAGHRLHFRPLCRRWKSLAMVDIFCTIPHCLGRSLPFVHAHVCGLQAITPLLCSIMRWP